MVDVQGTVARVAAGYSLKVPGAAQYSSADAHVTYSVEFDVSGADYATVLEQLESIEAQLHTNAKLAVYAQLGVSFDTTPSGVLVPILKEQPARAAAAPRSAAAAPKRGGYGQGGGTFGPAKAAGRELEVVVMGGIAYHDLRPLKEDGTYKPGAADFRSVEKVGNQKKQLWITAADGTVNDDVIALMEAAGLT